MTFRKRENIGNWKKHYITLSGELALEEAVRETDYVMNVGSSWNVMAHGDAREGKWRGNLRMQWVASTLYTTSEHGVSSITTADAHTSAASSRLNWRPRRFKWTRPFRQKTKSGSCACAITLQLASTTCSQFPLRDMEYSIPNADVNYLLFHTLELKRLVELTNLREDASDSSCKIYMRPLNVSKAH